MLVCNKDSFLEDFKKLFSPAKTQMWINCFKV